MTIEKVSQEEMLKQFKERLDTLQTENKKLADKIRDNEGVALKLLGAIEALSYYLDPEEEEVEETMSHPPDEEEETAE
jgi:predicted  nucleic acid-binding Zn-ribbon protein